MTSESVWLKCGQHLVCVMHIKRCRISSNTSGIALIFRQAASTMVRTERHVYASVLTNVRPVWNAICAAVLVPQHCVSNDELDGQSAF